MHFQSLPKTESGKLKFPGISLKSIQHKFDADATNILKKIPLLPQLLKIWHRICSEDAVYVLLTGQALRVTPRQYPRLYKVFKEAMEILDIPYEPDFFIQNSSVANAYAFGMDKKIMIVTTGITDILTEEELLFVIGHELGHMKFDHMLYKSLTLIIGQMGIHLLSQVMGGVAVLAANALRMGLLHWSRMAEFSADRAGFLVVQDKAVAQRALAKLAGYCHKYEDEEINIEEVLLQAKQLDEFSSLQALYKYMIMIDMTHPFIPYRVRELEEWAKTEEYQRIIGGIYETEDEYNRRISQKNQPYPSFPPPYHMPYPYYPPYQPYPQPQMQGSNPQAQPYYYPPYPPQPYPAQPYQPYQQFPQQPQYQQPAQYQQPTNQQTNPQNAFQLDDNVARIIHQQQLKRDLQEQNQS
ncbi:MAG: M48 family metallopeptidase [bacterium]